VAKYKKIQYRKKRTDGHTLALPELLPGLRGRANWHVSETGGFHAPGTINHLGGKAEMYLPPEDTPEARWVRLHELLHAAHSPLDAPQDAPRPNPKHPPIQKMAIILAEEMRINAILRAKTGSKFQAKAHNPELVKNFIQQLKFKPKNTEMIIDLLTYNLGSWVQSPYYIRDITTPLLIWMKDQRALAKPKSPEYVWWSNMVGFQRQVMETLEPHVTSMISHALRNVMPTWDNTIAIADIIDAILRRLPTLSDALEDLMKQAGPPKRGEEDLQDVGAWTRKDPQLNLSPIMDPGSIADDPEGKSIGKKDVIFNNKYPYPKLVKWAPMEIVTPKLPMKLPGKKRQSQKARATDAGTVPRYVHRILIDQQPFARKRREPAGSVLIDDSGSMGWEDKEIAAIVQAAPGVAIGAYSGSRYEGELVIVAKDGKWQNTQRPKGGGNDVDGPALEWLAEQPEPRIWVTDGAVVPIEGDPLEAAEQCIAFARKYKINVVPNVEAAREVFEGNRALYR